MGAELDRLDRAFGWRPPAGGAGAAPSLGPSSAFDADEARLLARSEDVGSYVRSRVRCLADLVASHGSGGALWDIGCGTGGVGRELARRGIEVIGVEPSAPAAHLARARGLVVLGTEFEHLSLVSASLSQASLFDVLEHLEAPERLLAEAARCLAPHGRLLISVPSGPWLWSEMDDHAGHHWRATASSLRALVCPHGFDVVRIEHWAALAVPAIALMRTVPYRLGRRHDRVTALTIAERELATGGRGFDVIVERGLRLERRVRRRLPLPVGASILAVFERRSA